MKWKGKLIKNLIKELEKDFNKPHLHEKIVSNENSIGIHLAIFSEPYLSLIFRGEKTIESRFSKNKIGPYAKISKGDIVLMKKSGGPVIAYFIAGNVEYISNISKSKMKEIENNFGKQICTHYDCNFWKVREETNYITLIDIKRIKRINSILIEKRDRTGWVVLQQKEQVLFEV